MKKKFNKGLSDIVSTLLILLLVFVAVAIVWVVVRNVINQGTEQISLGKFTLDLKIERVQIDEDLNRIFLTIKRNPGEGEFEGMKIIVSDDKNSEIFNVNESLEEGEKDYFEFNLANIDSSNLKSIQVAPIFRLSSGKEVVGDVKDTWESSEGISNFVEDEGEIILPPANQTSQQCIVDSNCTADYYSANYCHTSGDVYRNYYDFYCNATSQCDYTQTPQIVQDCNSTQTCSNGVCVNIPAQNTREGLIFAPTLNPATFMTDFYCSGNCPQVKILPEGSGNYVMESYLSRTTSTRLERTEVVPHSPNEAYQFQYGKDYWFGFSLYITENFIFDDLCGDAFVQFHAREDDGAEDGCTRNPPVAFYSQGGRLILGVKSDSKENTCESGSRVYETSDEYDIGTLNKGAWNDFVMHIKWSYNETGILELWHDDELVVQHYGGNCFNDDRGPYTKMGVYKWDYDNVPFKTCGIEEITYYHDEIRLGGPDSSYEDVAPDNLPNID